MSLMLVRFARKGWKVAWLLILFAAHYSATAAQLPAILVMGDSLSAGYGMKITQSWVALLEQRLRKEGYGYRVINASISGETTTGGRARLTRALEQHRPAIVILELGGNDGLRGLPLRQIRSNLETMITDAKRANAEVLLLGMRIPPNYGEEYGARFYGTFGELAAQYKVPAVSFFLDKVALQPSLLQADQIHPTAAAQPLLLDTVWPTLRPLLKKQTTKSIVAGG
jgi:acyl-CoA thioesterase I